MSFCRNWEEIYKANQHLAVWPWSDVVSASLRHTNMRNAGDDFAVLEVGCGAGANFPFYLTHTSNVYGIDGSDTVISLLKTNFPLIADKLYVGDFTKPWDYNVNFDLIIDRAASAHNPVTNIKQYLANAYQFLKPGGVLVITDWFSKLHSDYAKAPESLDEHTKSGYTWGPFNGVGQVTFFDDQLILDLVKDFEILSMGHSQAQSYGSNDQHATWGLILRKAV
jgi:SAM-dependent methyltransferase